MMKKEDAIQMLNRLLLYYNECPHQDCEKCVEAINMAIDVLEQEPSCRNTRQVDLKRGKWIDVECQIGMQCSECGKMCSEITLRTDMMTKAHWNYCPNCGARMESDEE